MLKRRYKRACYQAIVAHARLSDVDRIILIHQTGAQHHQDHPTPPNRNKEGTLHTNVQGDFFRHRRSMQHWRQACVLLFLPLLLDGRPSVDDVHNRELHGPSVRHLHEKMSTTGRYGAGQLTEDDISILFLRYQREFNRSLASGTYNHKTMTIAYESFADAARRLAALIADPTGPQSRGVQLALNEISDISEDDWEAMVEAGRRRLVMPFAPPQRRQERAQVRGVLDWREMGMLSDDILSLHQRAAPASPRDKSRVLLSGTVEAKALCLDALYIRSAGGNTSALPRGGFGHMARHSPELAEALGAGRAGQRDGGWGQRQDEGGVGFQEGLLELPDSFLASHARNRPPLFQDSATFVDERPPTAPGVEQTAESSEGGRGSKEEEVAREDEKARAAREWLASSEVHFRALPAGDELMLQVALQQEGPLAVSVDLSDPALQFYRGGLYTGGLPRCEERRPTHALAVIGFAEGERGSYWLLQNSWGRSWGVNGTISFAKGSNLCGLATNAVYAVHKGRRQPPPPPGPRSSNQA